MRFASVMCVSVLATVSCNASKVGSSNAEMPKQKDTAKELEAVARGYVENGLNGKNFDAIPYHDNVELRAPIGPNGSWTPFVGKESLRNDWWKPLPGLIGEATVLSTMSNPEQMVAGVEFHLVINTNPPITLRILDRFHIDENMKIVKQENFFDPRDLTHPGWRAPKTEAPDESE